MTTKFSSKGFTLIELLVVMAILGILMGLVVPKIGRMMEEAKENKCRNNLRQLQAAVMSHVGDKSGALPYAMSYEVYEPSGDLYYERRGWISWKPPQGESLGERWTHTAKGQKQGGADIPKENGMIEDFGIGDDALYGIENGSLYQYMNKSFEHYACPLMRTSEKVYRTYAMNGFFRSPENPSWWPRYLSKIATAEEYDSYKPESAKLLLFSEILAATGSYVHSGADAADSGCDKKAPQNSADCCFAPPSETFSTTGDQIHTIHRSGKPSVQAALAVFLDGHIEKVFHKNDKDENSVWFYNRGLDPNVEL